jgi:hypothetical protein
MERVAGRRHAARAVQGRRPPIQTADALRTRPADRRRPRGSAADGGAGSGLLDRTLPEFGQFGVQAMPQGAFRAQFFEQLFGAGEDFFIAFAGPKQRAPTAGHFLLCKHVTPRELAGVLGNPRRPVATVNDALLFDLGRE